MATAPLKLDRGLGLAQATALNMIDMVGIGPFIVIPLVIQDMGGPQCLLAWALGALVALLDGFVWAELGAAMPEAGGSYVFLRECYGPGKWGRLMAFLFVWQTLIQAPLVMASGAIGFAQYLSYLVPLGRWEMKAVSGGLIVVVVALLYRRITDIGKLSLLLWAGVMGTLGWMIYGGVTHFHRQLAFSAPEGAWRMSWVFFAGLGLATGKTIYTYWGYYNVCNLGGEIREPQKNIPRGIFLSILGVGALYLALQTSILGVIPWREARNSPFIVSTFMERLYGAGAGKLATVLILWVAFASLFALTLGYSRVPYAAALDGNFFAIFGRLHPEKKFPYVALLALGTVAFVFSLSFRLGEVITAILAMRLVVQFMGQAAGVMLLHKRWPEGRLPFKMWGYPLQALLTLAAWAGLFLATGEAYVLGGLMVTAAGSGIFLIRSRARGEWPFAAESSGGQ